MKVIKIHEQNTCIKVIIQSCFPTNNTRKKKNNSKKSSDDIRED